MTNRDGFQSSLWQGTSQPYRSAVNHPVKALYDVIVVGGGITGVTTADSLCREGLTVLLLEARTLCYGTTGGTTAHINSLLDVPYTQLIQNFDLESITEICNATRQTIETMRSTVNELGIDCGWRETQAFLFAETGEQAEELQEIAKSCRQVGLKPEMSRTLPVPIPFEAVLTVEPQARFHPVRYVHALAKRFEENGGKLIEDCRVIKINESESHVELETLKGTYSAKWIVLATHIPPGINVVHMRCTPYRSYAMALKVPSHQHFDGLVYDMQDPYHYYRMQEIDGASYLVAGGKDHKTGHEKHTTSKMRELESHVRKYFKVGEVVNTWSSQYYESADGLPYVGQLPGHSHRILTATGFGGNGMTYSSIAASVITDIIMGRDNSLIDLLSPSRIKPIAGFRNVASHNLDVTRAMIGSLFKPKELEGFSELAHEEGRIFTSGDEKVAISKDEQGAIHAVSAACTHMGCKVTWNQLEKSWDCPCHGARYDIDGSVLNGPAVIDLAYINTEIVGSAIEG